MQWILLSIGIITFIIIVIWDYKQLQYGRWFKPDPLDIALENQRKEILDLCKIGSDILDQKIKETEVKIAEIVANDKKYVA